MSLSWRQACIDRYRNSTLIPEAGIAYDVVVVTLIVSRHLGYFVGFLHQWCIMRYVHCMVLLLRI